MLSNDGGAMLPPDQIRFADVDVHASRSGWQIVEVVRAPIVYGIVLDEGESTLLVLGDPHGDPRVAELLTFRLNLCITPPSRHVVG